MEPHPSTISTYGTVLSDLILHPTCAAAAAAAVCACSDLLVFKTIQAGNVGAESKSAKVMTAASGFWTYWNDVAPTFTDPDAEGSLTEVKDGNNNNPTTEQCLAACDADAACAGVAITGATKAAATKVGCKMIKGTTASLQKQTLIRANAGKLSLPDNTPGQ